MRRTDKVARSVCKRFEVASAVGRRVEEVARAAVRRTDKVARSALKRFEVASAVG